MSAIRYPLTADRYRLSDIHALPSVNSAQQTVVRYPLSAIRYPLSAFRYPPSATRFPPDIVILSAAKNLGACR
jgi:hypothetical protein